MGFISLPDNVTPSQYNDWRKNSAAGQRYSQSIESKANKGYSVSHAPPGEAITSWLNQRNPAGPASYSPQRGLDMSAYRPQTSSGQQSSVPDMSTYNPNPYVSEGQFRNMFSGGQAQSRQQSFGTPYGQSMPAGMPVPEPQSMPASRPSAQSQGYFNMFPRQPPQMSMSGDPRGMYAMAPIDQRPAPFTVDSMYGPMGETSNPFADRDAILERIMSLNMDRQMRFNQTSPFPMSYGSPFFNYGSLTAR